MVQRTRILAALALVVVSVTVDAVQQPMTSSRNTVVVQHEETRMLLAEAGSTAGSKATGGAVGGDVAPVNQPILAQWLVAKAMLEKAFAGEPTLMAKLAAFEAKVMDALKTPVDMEVAKTMIPDFLAVLEADPAYKKVEAQLTTLKALLTGAGISSSNSSNSTSSAGTNSTVAGPKGATNSTIPTLAPAVKGGASNSSGMTPAPTTTSAASTLVAFAAPVALAIAAVFASL